MRDFDLIETSENVELQRRLAGIGSRFLAGFIDNFLIALVYLVLAIILFVGLEVPFGFGADEGGAHTWFVAIVILAVFSIYWGYFVLFELWTNGQSPGKKYMKIRVVALEGGGISFRSIAIRNLLRAVDMIGGYAVAGIAMFVTDRIQRLGDLAAGTLVVSEYIADYSANHDKRGRVTDAESVTSEALEATGLKPEEYAVLRNYWLRRSELNIEARMKLLPKLIDPVMKRNGWNTGAYSLDDLEKYLDDLMSAGTGDRDRARPSTTSWRDV
jgi:uncharacterized RDD family membrane protein YckC